MQWFFIFLLSFGLASADLDDKQFSDYLQLLKDHPKLAKLGNYKDGDIEIVIDKKTVEKISKMQTKRFISEGEKKDEANEHSKIGVIARDKYWIWIRDAVIFPSGASGTYDRIVKTSDILKNPNNGVSILPVTADKKILLVVIYRHALRDWSIEVPKGSIDNNDPLLVSTERKLRYETGLNASEFIYLGDIVPDSGTSALTMPCYFAKVTAKGIPRPCYSEAILGIIELSVDEVKKGLCAGSLDVDVKGKKVKGLMKDAYLTHSLLMAEQKKLL